MWQLNPSHINEGEGAPVALVKCLKLNKKNIFVSGQEKEG
jgi:hypothetical protein